MENNILDKIFTNADILYPSTQILPEIGTSDHKVVLSLPNPDVNSFNTHLTTTSCVRQSGRNERTMFAHALQQVNWTPLYPMKSCSEQFSFFMDTMNGLLDTHLPWQIKTKFVTDKSWITQTFKDQIIERQTTLRAGNTDAYKTLRNSVTRMSKSFQLYHFCNKVEQNKTANPKKW